MTVETITSMVLTQGYIQIVLFIAYTVDNLRDYIESKIKQRRPNDDGNNIESDSDNSDNADHDSVSDASESSDDGILYQLKMKVGKFL